MNNSVFIRILQTFSPTEFKDFDKFVNSPYFNTSLHTSEVFKAVKDYYPHFKSDRLCKKSVFETVHPGKKYNDALMRKYISNLNKLSEKFIIINNNKFPEQSLVSGLLSRKLYKLFLQRLEKIENKISPDIIDDDYFQYAGLIKGERLNFYNITDKEFDFQKGKLELIEIDTMYFFYRIAQINYRTQSLAKDNDYGVMDYLLSGINIKKLYEKIESSEIHNKPVLKFLLSLPLLQQTRDEKLYREIKKFSLAYSDKHGIKSIFIGFLYLFDFITYKIEQGNYEYYKERYQLYKYEEQVRYRNDTEGKITFYILRNYFNSALRNDDINWAQYLVDKYTDRFSEEAFGSLRKYFNAFIHFHKKEYKNALESIAGFNINKHSLEDFAYIRETRTLFLQIYFELGYVNEAFYSIDSFYHYLNHNKKINLKNRTYYGNFVKYYKELITMASKDNYSNLSKLKKNIIADKVIKKLWLLEKIAEIESK